jgi:hypothetical protein
MHIYGRKRTMTNLMFDSSNTTVRFLYFTSIFALGSVNSFTGGYLKRSTYKSTQEVKKLMLIPKNPKLKQDTVKNSKG